MANIKQITHMNSQASISIAMNTKNLLLLLLLLVK